MYIKHKQRSIKLSTIFHYKGRSFTLFTVQNFYCFTWHFTNNCILFYIYKRWWLNVKILRILLWKHVPWMTFPLQNNTFFAEVYKYYLLLLSKVPRYHVTLKVTCNSCAQRKFFIRYFPKNNFFSRYNWSRVEYGIILINLYWVFRSSAWVKSIFKTTYIALRICNINNNILKYESVINDRCCILNYMIISC